MNEATLIKISNRDLYKALKNYLHNELGISKQVDKPFVEELVQKIIVAKIDKLFADQHLIEKMIERKIAEVIQKGTFNRYGYDHVSFEKIVLGEIKSAVRDHVIKKLDIQIALSSQEPKEEH